MLLQALPVVKSDLPVSAQFPSSGISASVRLSFVYNSCFPALLLESVIVFLLFPLVSGSLVSCASD